MNLEEKNSREIEEFLKSKGAEVVGFASFNPYFFMSIIA